MQMIESNVAERAQLPLPAAALVIDIRGVSDDDVIDWLAIEIADLASEMKTYNVHHWRYLTDFLSFMRISPVRKEKGLVVSNEEDEGSELQGPMGQVYRFDTSPVFSYDGSENGADANSPENMPSHLFEQKIDELVREIDRVRNNRIVAVTDLNNAGIPGQSSRDATVRIIFLTDAKDADSLSSAALYAEALKKHYKKFHRPNHQQLINTTVLCLGNDGQAGPPKLLIENLRRNNSWEHLDSLIMSEDYRDDAAWIAGTMQAYLAELLLYVLLIIPPFNISTPVDTTVAAANGNGAHTQQLTQPVELPLNTYIVGLAALEYSARWGRRWLNFGIAKELVDILRQKPVDPSKEKMRLAGVTDSWFKDWRGRVRNTFPDNVPSPTDVPALEGVLRARQVARQKQSIFSTKESPFRIKETTLRDLNEFQDTLLGTYITTGSEQAMQDSLVQSTQQVMLTLHQRASRSLEERQVTDLGKLQVEAEQLLSNSRFFLGAAGALPRARTQLLTLGTAISRFRQEHQNNPLNPLSGKSELKKRAELLEQAGKKRIEDLKAHMDNYPLVGNAFNGTVKSLLGLFTLLFILFITAMLLTTGVAWFHHLLVINFAESVPTLDYPVLGIPLLALMGTLIALIIVASEAVGLWSRFMNKDNPAAMVELAFCLALFVIVLLGLLVNYSLGKLHTLDPASYEYLSWISFMPLAASIAAGLLAIILVVEIIYFGFWLDHIYKERAHIVTQQRRRQQEDLQDVIDFIADDISLEILLAAELTDGKSDLGGYYHRIDQLCDLLDEVAEQAGRQQKLAANRLLLSQSETQQGMNGTSTGSTWLNLHIRDEVLDMQALIEGYKDVRLQLTPENSDLCELAEILLRVESVEKLEEIEQEVADRPSRVNGEQRRAQLLTAMLTSVAMHFAVEPLSDRNINPVMEHYKRTDSMQLQLPALGSLLKTLNKRVGQTMLTSQANTFRKHIDAVDSAIVTDALAVWGQLFWRSKLENLDEALMQDGVLTQFMHTLQKNYDPRAIMRKLLAHTVLFGRNLHTARKIDLFLLLAPSQRSHQFLQGLKSMRIPRTIDFPDAERILLLGVQHFKAEPLQLAAPEEEEI